MAGAVIAALVLTFLLPNAVRPGPNWLLPLIEGVLLVALIIGDPGEIDRRSRLLRGLSIGLVSVLVISSLWATVELISDLIQGGPETSSAGDVYRLPVPGLHQRHRVQPDRRHAARALGEDRDGGAVAHLARHPRSRDRTSGERVHLALLTLPLSAR